MENSSTVVRALTFILLVIFIILLINNNINYYFGKNSAENAVLRLAEKNNDYKMCFIGTSSIRMGINTRIVNERLNTKSIVCSENGQLVYDNYIILEQLLENNPIDTVVIDADYFMYTKDRYRTASSSSTSRTLSYIKPSFKKLKFIAEICSKNPDMALTILHPRLYPTPLKYGWSKYYSVDFYYDNMVQEDEYTENRGGGGRVV